jgi:hypothetical protein
LKFLIDLLKIIKKTGIKREFWREFANFCTISFIKVFLKSFFENKKKNVYPVHTPAAVDYIMFNFGEYVSIRIFVWRAFIKQSSYLWSKKRAFGVKSHKEINIPVEYLNKSV